MGNKKTALFANKPSPKSRQRKQVLQRPETIRGADVSTIKGAELKAVLEHHGLKVKFPGEKADGQRERLRSHLEALPSPGPAPLLNSALTTPLHTKKCPFNLSALMSADAGSLKEKELMATLQHFHLPIRQSGENADR